MHLAAVIAEYNPLHNGHLYQLNEIRRLTGADGIIVMMSGDFVQRGAPACADKYARTRMALEAGADIVCELPSYGACSSAEIFAESAVSLLNRFGCVDWLCFGAETDTPEIFDTAARIMCDEPSGYRDALHRNLCAGNNFPASRIRALCEYLNDDSYAEILSLPNNILAVEYTKAIIKTESSIKPVVILRTGEGHHSTGSSSGYSSATAVRGRLKDISARYFDGPADDDAAFDLKSELSLLDIPGSTASILTDYMKNYPLPDRDDFSDLLACRLIQPGICLTDYIDVSEDLANRILKYRDQFRCAEQFTALLTTKNYTSVRISRCLFHILLGHKKSLLNTWRSDNYRGYLKILGFKRSISSFWKEIPDDFRKEIIVQTPKRQETLTGTGRELYESDLYASRLYRQIIRSRSLTGQPVKDPLSEPVIII